MFFIIFDLPQFEFGNVSENMVMEKLKKINAGSSLGCVNIDARIFKDCAEELTPTITDLFNLRLGSNTIPDEWKVAHVTPIYKVKGTKSSLDNYRPISILSPISKVFEALVGHKMRVYLENNNIFHQDQNGFRDGRSCHLALNTIVDYAKRNLDNKHHVMSIFLDLSKAFDTIDHQLLLI